MGSLAPGAHRRRGSSAPWTSPGRSTAIDGKVSARYPAGLLRSQVYRGPGDIFGLTEARQHRFAACRLTDMWHAIQDGLSGTGDGHTGADAIRPDVVRGAFHRKLARHRQHTALACAVRQ